MTDPSNGYEGVAAEFLAGRGRAPSTAIGARAVRDWARRLPGGAAVIDLGCGSGLPITKVLVSEDLNVYAIDAAPSLVEAFRHNLPKIPVVCEAVEDSLFFNRMFDGVLAWGSYFYSCQTCSGLSSEEWPTYSCLVAACCSRRRLKK